MPDQVIQLPDGNTATFPADWTPGMIQSKLWDTFPQWRPQGPMRSFSPWDSAEGEGNLAVRDYPSYDAYLAERKDQQDLAEAEAASHQDWLVPPSQRGTPMLSELRPMMERVAQEWGVHFVTGDELRKDNPGSTMDLDAMAKASNKATIDKVRDEALRRLQGMKTGEAIRTVGSAMGDPLAPVTAAIASGEAQRAAQQAGVGIAESLKDPVNLAAIGASVVGGPPVAIPIWAAFSGQAIGQAAGSWAGGAPLEQKLSETAQAAVMVAPLAHPTVRTELGAGVREIATDLTNLRRFLAPATTRAATSTATPAAVTPPAVAPVPAPRPPLAQLGTAVEAVNNASLSVAESGTIPFASVNRALTNLRAQLEAARKAARVSGARTAPAGQQPTQAATGALEAGAAAPGAAADAAYATARKAIDDATAAVLRNQAGVVDAQQAATALSAAAAAASSYHTAIGGQAPQPQAQQPEQPYTGPAPLPRKPKVPKAPNVWAGFNQDQKLEALAQKGADPVGGRFQPYELAFLNQLQKDPVLNQRFLDRQAELKAERSDIAKAVDSVNVDDILTYSPVPALVNIIRRAPRDPAMKAAAEQAMRKIGVAARAQGVSLDTIKTQIASELQAIYGAAAPEMANYYFGPPTQPAAATAAQPGGPSASSQQETAAVHGNLRTQPGQGPGQVPTTQGGGGVQPQAQGGLREQATVATPPLEIEPSPAAAPKLTQPTEATTPLSQTIRELATMPREPFVKFLDDTGLDSTAYAKAVAKDIRSVAQLDAIGEMRKAAAGVPVKEHFFDELYRAAQINLLSRASGGTLRWQDVDRLRSADPAERWATAEQLGLTHPQDLAYVQRVTGVTVQRPAAPPTYTPPPATGTILDLDLYSETIPSLQRFTQRDLFRLAQREGAALKSTATKEQLAGAALKFGEFNRRVANLDFPALQAIPKEGLQYLLKLIGEETPSSLTKTALAERILQSRGNLATIRKENVAAAQRYYAVRDALRRGEYVPQDVIDQYPELRREGAEPTPQRQPGEGPPRPAPLAERWKGHSDADLIAEYKAFRQAYEADAAGVPMPSWEAPPSGAKLPRTRGALARQLRAMEAEFDRRELDVPWEGRMHRPFGEPPGGSVHEAREPDYTKHKVPFMGASGERGAFLDRQRSSWTAYRNWLVDVKGWTVQDANAHIQARWGQDIPVALWNYQPPGTRRVSDPLDPGTHGGPTAPHEDRGPARGDPPDIARQAANQLNAIGGPGGPEHGLPPGVPPGPPNFAAQLMEASRRMNKLIRSSTTLPPKVQGRYIETVEGDHIEVNNVRNQRVEAHEITHGLDAELFPTQFAMPMSKQSQQSLLARVAPHGVTGVTKGELFRQLASVSELMRGPLDTAYRRRASELIADWGSLYLHDPARARAMAPDWTRGFENALALPGNSDLLETVRQLHRQQVEPVPGQLGPGVSSVVMQATKTPGVVGIRPTPAPPPHLLDIAIAAQRFVKDSVRTLAAEEQRARVWGDKARRMVPNEGQRKDVGAFVEGSGNIERQGDDIGTVKARMTQPMKNLVMDFRHRIEHLRERLNYYLKGIDEGEYLAYLKDYLPHFYVQNEQYGAALSKFLKESPNAKARIIPSLEEARRMGFHPISQDPAVLYELYSRINWQVATNRRLVEEIGRLRTPDGQPVVLPSSIAPDNWRPLENQAVWTKFWARRNTEGKTMLWRGDMKAHPDVYYAIRQVLNYPISTPGKVYDAVNAFTRSAAFSLSGFHDVSLSFASLAAQFRWFAHPNPARGLVRLMERDPVTGHRVPFQFTGRAGEKLLQIEDAVADAAQHGLRFAWTDSAVFEYTSSTAVDQILRSFEKLPGFKYYAPLQRALRDLVKWRQEGLWSKTHDALKMMAYHDIVLKAIPRLEPGVDTSLLKERVASYLNDAFGGQDWQTHFWASPVARRTWGRFMLAPDWTLSTMRSLPFVSDIATGIAQHLPQRLGQASPPGLYEGWPKAPRIKGMDGNLLRLKFWSAEVAAVLTTSMAMQWAIARMFGDPQEGDHLSMFDNEAGANPLGDARYTVDVTPIMRMLERNGIIKALQDVPVIKELVPEQKYPTRQYMSMGKRASESMRWFMDPFANIEAKVSRPVAELVKQLSGREGNFAAEWKQEDNPTPEFLLRIKSMAKNVIPFVFTGNQFVLTQPMRKGMTRYKAQEAFEGILEMVADPNAGTRWLRSWMQGRPKITAVTEGDLQSMMDQVSDAAERNGINPAEPLRAARNKVLGFHLSAWREAFFKKNEAVLAGDKRLEARYDKIMEEQAPYIQRLGISSVGLKASMRSHIRTHIPPKPADVTMPPAPQPTPP